MDGEARLKQRTEMGGEGGGEAPVAECCRGNALHCADVDKYARLERVTV